MPTRLVTSASAQSAQPLPCSSSGTAITADDLRGICEAVLEENARRERRGERAVFLMYDHIYWMLTAHGTTHVTPPQLVPEMARGLYDIEPSDEVVAPVSSLAGKVESMRSIRTFSTQPTTVWLLLA